MSLSKGLKSRCRVSPAVLMLLVAICSAACNQSNQSPQLNDTQLRETIHAHWNEDSGFRVFLGTFEITRGSADVTKGRLSAPSLKSYKAWEEVGLIKINLVKDLTARFSGWDDWNKQFLDGVQSVVRIEPTDKGLPMKKEEEGELPPYLQIPRGDFVVDEIIKKAPLRLGVDDYEVVWGTHTVNYTPEALSYYEKFEVEMKKDRKFKALLRFDPFKSDWKVIVEDIADLDQEFPTDNINDLLRKWGAGTAG
jgi:hypothetical protein